MKTVFGILLMATSLEAYAIHALPSHKSEAWPEIELTADLAALFVKPRNPESYKFEQQALINLNPNKYASPKAITVQSRGSSRLENCDFPPLKITSLEGPLLGQKSLKMVTWCKEEEKANTIREWLVYKLFQQIDNYSTSVTPAVLRVLSPQLDSKGSQSSSLEGPIFFVESKKQLASRLKVKKIEEEEMQKKGLDLNRVDKTYFIRTMIFNYMISNYDSFISDEYVHNFMPIKNSKGNIYLVPYDFDQSDIAMGEAVWFDGEENIRGLCGIPADSIYKQLLWFKQQKLTRQFKKVVKQALRSQNFINFKTVANFYETFDNFELLLIDPPRMRELAKRSSQASCKEEGSLSNRKLRGLRG